LSVTRKLMNFAIAIVLTAFICGLMIALPPFYPNTFRDPEVALGVFFGGWIFSLPLVALGGLLFGMPIAFALKTRKVSGYSKWPAVGAIAGALFSILIMAVVGGLPPSAPHALAMGWLGIPPGLAAGLYWWAAVGRREQIEGDAF
jgi:hypothetical protein